MGNIKFITLKENIVEEVGNILLSSKDISKNIIIFPNRRPGYFLDMYLYEKQKKAFKNPLIFSIDRFIDWAFNLLFSEPYKEANELDLIYFLYKDFEKTSKDITLIKEENYNLSFFMPWAYKIISDFEEIKINNVKLEELKNYNFILGKDVLEKISGFKNKYETFSKLYEKFYQKCAEMKIYTRAMKYDYVSKNILKLDFSKYENIIFAGFFALTNSEKEIFRYFNKNFNNSTFVYIYSPLLKDEIPFEYIEIPDFKDYKEKNKILFIKTSSEHEEIFELKNILNNEAKEKKGKLIFDSDSLLLIPDSNMILPVVENVLCDIDKFNISAGYPLKMTPIYSLLKTLFNLISSSHLTDEYRYDISAYFKFMFHPYIKNLKIGGKAQDTRKYIQELRRKISDDKNLIKYFSLNNLEEISGWEYLREIHNLIKPFESIKNIEDFSDKIKNFLIYIIENSTAYLHPYWGYFPQIILEKIAEIKNSRLIELSFESVSSYFSFFESYINFQTYPFKGSPIEGLQCLGFLESRNLKFEKIFFLDVNDGIIPNLKKEDTILPHYIRKKLGLSTYLTSRDIYLYYFENIVFSAKKSYLFYIDDKNREASPFIEKIKWEIQKNGGDIEEYTFILNTNFSHKKIKPINKNTDIREYLKNLEYSYSSVDEYLKCQIRFYYSHVLKIKESSEIEISYDKKDIGNLIHQILEKYFTNKKQYSFKDKNKEKKEIINIAEDIFNSIFSKEIIIEEYILKKQILNRLNDFIDFLFDQYNDISIISCEKEYKCNYQTSFGNFILKSKIDRIDERKGEIFIVDYKTSTDAKKYLPYNQIDKIDFSKNILEWGRKINSLQLPIYIYVYHKVEKIPIDKINASIILLGSKKIKEEVLSKKIKFDFYIEILEKILKSIINDDKFLPPLDDKECENCPYKIICDRQML